MNRPVDAPREGFPIAAFERALQRQSGRGSEAGNLQNDGALVGSELCAGDGQRAFVEVLGAVVCAAK